MRRLGTKEWIAVVVSVGLVLYFFVFSGNGSVALNPLVTDLSSQASSTPMDNTTEPAATGATSGIIITDTVVGTGVEAKSGNTVSVHYTGTFADGRVFDSSVTRGQPFVFNLGAGDVIKGWDEGVVGMKVGGKRTLVISPEKAYGATGAGGVIPPNATLTFVVELLEVK